jgi:hypothetical protein
VEITTTIEGAVIHQAIAEEVVEQVVLVTDFGRVEHIGRMIVVHVLEIVMGRRRREIIEVQNLVIVQYDVVLELDHV